MMAPAEKSGYAAYNEGLWSNPYESKWGLEFEAWQWDLGWDLAKHMREAGL